MRKLTNDDTFILILSETKPVTDMIIFASMKSI